MEPPQLFGLDQDWFVESARILLIPTLGFCFVYLLGLPLKSLPVLKVEDYNPPKWVVPLFALGSLFVLMLFSAISVSMYIRKEPASAEAFRSSYHVVQQLDVKDLTEAEGTINASIILGEIDNLSNFQIFVNGVRVFGSTSHCVLQVQCRQRRDHVEQEYEIVHRQVLAAFSGGARSRYNLVQPFYMPHMIDITGYLVKGQNFIDFHSDSGGHGACEFRFLVSFRNGLIRRSHRVRISNSAPDHQHEEDAVLSPKQDPNGKFILPYMTSPAYSSHRICQRYRIEFELPADPLSGDRDALLTWVNRDRDISRCSVCGLLECNRDRGQGLGTC
jgi:hypothetical protein